ncbi:hypothetical protein ZIOFF_034490 [Zingiber officinale]|uniref:Mitochondrial protein n=1 Tax=Zingiber officinale TaxID=94328 RepID=A0A8J5GL04_ZINOF|nr:hypothetical protein ZIOFF_034490 [Zingiber officinale]
MVAHFHDTGHEAHAAAADLDGMLLVSRSSFRYFFLLAVKVGGFLHSATLLLLSSAILLVYKLFSEAHPDAHLRAGSNPSMFGEFKEAMTKEFKMTDIGLMAYYLGIEVNQREYGSFISQAGYAREILKKFRMDNSKSINTPVECGVKLSKHDEEEKVDPTFFKSLVGSLRYLTCTRPDILYVVGLVSRYMEDLTTTHLKIAKRILRYIKDTIDFGLLYSAFNHFKLEGYSDSDWGGDIDDRKSTTGFVFFMGDTAFTWMSKNQHIVTLSTCEAEYVAATSCVCHAVWLRNLLNELRTRWATGRGLPTASLWGTGRGKLWRGSSRRSLSRS